MNVCYTDHFSMPRETSRGARNGKRAMSFEHSSARQNMRIFESSG